jgi:hypothetical protein
MQAQAGQTSSLELADRRLIDARQRLHGALRQAGATAPLVPLAADPDKLLGDDGLKRPHFSVHGDIEADSACLTANSAFAATSPRLRRASPHLGPPWPAVARPVAR